ncbi:MAG: hypothetical protein GYA58_02825 [Anaerolineaceae bacterium]|nr:hypothetical protein [Anaerolineaceae bacterium]
MKFIKYVIVKTIQSINPKAIKNKIVGRNHNKKELAHQRTKKSYVSEADEVGQSYFGQSSWSTRSDGEKVFPGPSKDCFVPGSPQGLQKNVVVDQPNEITDPFIGDVCISQELSENDEPLLLN